MVYENLREIYLSVLRVRELQPNSINTYMIIFDSYVRYCGYLKKKPEDVSREEILFYLSKIKSESTRRQAKGVLINLYEFVLLQGFKMMGIPNPKRHYEVPDYFSLYELDLIFNHIKNEPTTNNIRKTKY